MKMGNCFKLKKKQKAPELPEDEKKPNAKKDPKKGEKQEAIQGTKDSKRAVEVEPEEEPKLEKKQEPEPKQEAKREPKKEPELEVPEEKQEEEPDELEEIINQHQIVVFSKTVCPLSDEAKGILEEEGIDYTLVELDTCKGFANLENQLGLKSGRECVPVIYVNGQLLGGACELSRAVESGKLAEMIKQKSSSDAPSTASNVRPRRLPETQKPTNMKNRYEN